MLSFATEFPLDPTNEVSDFLETMFTWLLGSPHSSLTTDDLAPIRQKEGGEIKRKNEKIEFIHAVAPKSDAVSIRYTKTEKDYEWITTVTCCKDTDGIWVGIRIFCESLITSTKLPNVKKPIIVKQLLETLNGGPDGMLKVSNTPLYLENTDIDIAARCITGEAGVRLPLVYISSNFYSKYDVNPKNLSTRLAGMAHIIVEPNRSFSIRLKHEVNSQNVYGGTIGVYWPDGAGRRKFSFLPDIESSKDLEDEIFEEIKTALCIRRPISKCTWTSVKEYFTQRALQGLREKGSQEVKDYIDTFDEQIREKNFELAEAEKNINRLQAELRKYQGKNQIQSTICFDSGEESDFYQGEIMSIVIDSLKEVHERNPKGTRRSHVIGSILQSTKFTTEKEEIRAQLKEILKDYTHLDAKIRRGLEELGFNIFEEGKHIKIIFQQDQRYSFFLPKSGSDHRGGLNVFSEISKKLL